MINKNLFFVWLGETPPSNHRWVIDAFRRYNPTFNITFIYDSIQNPTNNDVREVLDLIYTPSSIYHTIFTRPWAMKNLKTQTGLASNIVDCLKYYLIDKYGGIYLDLDTFPVKPFDDDLLKNQAFICHNTGFDDNFFIGCEQHNISFGNYHIEKRKRMIRFNDALRIDFNVNTDKMLLDKFNRAAIDDGFSIHNKSAQTDYYIDHYYCRTWKR